MKGATILFSEMTPDPDWEEDFNAWYDTDHIPARMKIDGFLSAQRYKERDRSNYLALYELSSPAALESEAYNKLREQPSRKSTVVLENVTDSARYLGNHFSEQVQNGAVDCPIDADVLYAVFFSVPDDRAKEFNAWYEEEHSPMLLKCADWLAVRRFDVFDGEPQPWTHLALHYLRDASALDSPELEAARNTEWRNRLAEEQWFRASFHLYERFGERFLKES